jgi:hypothetical protein
MVLLHGKPPCTYLGVQTHAPSPITQRLLSTPSCHTLAQGMPCHACMLMLSFMSMLAGMHAHTHTHTHTHMHAYQCTRTDTHSRSLTHRKSRWGGGQIFDYACEASRRIEVFCGLGAPGDTPGFAPERLKPARVPRGAASPPIYSLLPQHKANEHYVLYCLKT